MYEFIELLRALAVALITNSYFDGVYPVDISWGGGTRCIAFLHDNRILIGEKR